jgi:hypothetical protein
MSDELFSQGDVRVTKTMAYLGGTSYPINGITAVFVAQKKISVKAIIGGVVLGFFGLGILVESVLFGVVLLAVAVCLFYLAFYRPYRLMIRTAAGDTQALEGMNKEFIDSVRLAIESAVAQRG